MLPLNANNISRPQSNAPHSSSLSTQSVSESSPKSSHVEQRIAAAEEALREIRKRIPGKSTNKSYGHNPPPEKSKLYSQPALTNRFNTWQEEQKNSSIDKITLANCGDLSCLTWQNLMDRKHKNGQSQLGSIDLVEWSEPEHLCVALAQPLTNGKFPDNFFDWDKDAVICDVWANIVCKATDFPEEWKHKMAKWEGRGLKVTDGYDSALIDGQWVPHVMESPASEKWLTLPEKAAVRSYITYEPFYMPIYEKAKPNKKEKFKGYWPVITEMHKSGIALRSQYNNKVIV